VDKPGSLDAELHRLITTGADGPARTQALERVLELTRQALKEDPAKLSRAMVESAAEALAQHGNQLLASSDFDGAASYFGYALKLFEQTGERKKQARALNAIADVQLFQGRPKLALATSQRSFEVARTEQFCSAIFRAAHIRAKANSSLGDFAEMKAGLEELLGLHGRICEISESGLARTHEALAQAYSGLGSNEDAAKCARTAATLYGSLGQFPEQQNCLRTCGIQLNRARQPEAAERAFAEGAQISHPDVDPKDLAWLLLNRGINLAGLDRQHEAIPHLHEAESICEQHQFMVVLGLVQNSLGRSYKQIDQYDDAERHLRRAVEIHTSDDNSAELANALIEIADIAVRRENFQESLPLYEHALGLRPGSQALTSGDYRTQADFRNRYSFALNGAGIYGRSLKIAREGYDWSLRAGDPGTEALNLTSIGAALYKLGEIEESLDVLEESLDLVRFHTGKVDLARHLDYLTWATFDLRMYDAALSFSKEAVSLYRQLDQPGMRGTHNLYQGGIYRSRSQYSLALHHYEIGAHLLQTHAPRYAGQALLKLADLQEEMGLTGFAESNYLSALDLLLTTSSDPDSTNNLKNLGSALLRLKRHAEAIEVFELILSSDPGDLRDKDAAYCLHSLGVCLNQIHRRQDAIHRYSAALTLYRELGDFDNQILVLQNMGYVYWSLSERTQAVLTLEESLDLVRRHGTISGEIALLNVVGPYNREIGNARRAIEQLVRAKWLSEQIESRSARIESHHCAAQMHAKAATTVATDTSEGTYGIVLDHRALARTHFESAIALIEETRGRIVPTAERLEFSSEHSNIYREFAAFLVGAEPAADLTTAFEMVQKGKARSFLDSLYRSGASPRSKRRTEAARLYQENWAEIGELDRELSEVADALLRMELYGTFESSDEDDERDHRAELVERKVALERDVLERREKLDALETRVAREDPDFAFLFRPPTVSLDELANELLESDGALLEFSCQEDVSHVYCLTLKSGRACLSVHELPGGGYLRDKVRELRASLLHRMNAYPHGFRLFKDLFGSTLGELEDKTELLVCPDGPLNFLPFVLLLDRDPDGEEADEDSAGGQRDSADVLEFDLSIDRDDLSKVEIGDLRRALSLVGDRDWRAIWGELPYAWRNRNGTRRPRSLSYSSSGLVANHFERKRRQRDGSDAFYEHLLLAVSQPVSDREPEDTAPTASEVKAITHALQQSQFGAEEGSTGSRFNLPVVRTLVGPDATKSSVSESLEGSRYRYVHFAAHSVVNNMSPELSGIKLARSPDEEEHEAYLRAYEVTGISIETELLTLSCCETGSGPNPTGEGIISLARAFQQAGAIAVCATGWRIPDEETVGVMSNFYSALSRGESAGESLIEAQMKCARSPHPNISHPFSWAGFGLWR